MITVEETKQLLTHLGNLDLKQYPDEEVKKAIRGFRAYPLNVTEFHIGNVIYRIRPNTGNKSFTNASDLSYKPQAYNKTYQRASSPQATMFYGSIIPQENLNSEVDMARVIAATEASNLIRNKDSADGVEIVSFGKWRVLDTISLGTVVYSEVERNVTPYAKGRAKYVLELLEKSPDIAQQGKLMMDFIASEFSKKEIRGDFDYIISALFTERIIEKGFDGVIYPSVRAEEKGMNVAILPNVVDNRMRLEGVVECKVYKQGSDILVEDSQVAWINADVSELNFISIEDDIQRRGGKAADRLT
jgi:hypothetical protein